MARPERDALWQNLARIVVLILKTSVASGALYAAAMVRTPAVSELRPWPLIAVVAVATALVTASRRWFAAPGHGWIARLDLAPFILAALALVLALTMEGQFQRARWSVAHAEPDGIERLGRHIIVGYRDPAFVRDLVERRAIAGVFLTQRNVAHRTIAAIRQEIDELQAIRLRQGLPPLWVATDQEGGMVSRLSPPLEQQPPLARVVEESKNREELRNAVTAYATNQGRGLAAIGVNLNFAPVVDLNFGISNPDDSFTRIASRALSADPSVVSDVAGWYCDGLAAQRVHCTLKHFPGLGRVFDDTHVSEGRLDAAPDELERMDWIPFRQLLGRSSSVLMVGHVQVPALDATQPASTSRQAITGLIRTKWGYDGIVITDDMNMGAILSGPGGIEEASIRALNAGADLLLLSWDGKQIYPVLSALLQARSLDLEMLDKSALRLQAVQAKL